MFDSMMVFLKDFFKKFILKKKLADDKKHAKFPSRLRVIELRRIYFHIC